MLTRGRKSDEDDWDEKMCDAIKKAGADPDGMNEAEKKSFYAAVVNSQDDNCNRKNEDLYQNSPGSPSDRPEPSPDVEAETSNNDVVMEENVGRLNKAITFGQPGTSQSPKTAGRGRAKPVRTKYPVLDINCSPGQKPDSTLGPQASSKLNNSSSHLASPGSAHSPASVSSSGSPPPVVQRNGPGSPDGTTVGSAGSHSPPSQSFQQNSPDIYSQDLFDNLLEAEKEGPQGDNEILVDVESRGPEETAVCDIEPDSPASVQDAGGDEKEPVKTIFIGKVAAQVSPLESMNRGLPPNGFSDFFQDLEKYRGDKALWMAKANEKVRECRIALWKKLKEENPIWGPPITDGGSFNKRTLFKETTPKFSQLFSSSPETQVGTTTTHGRADRQSKTRAVTKIQEAMSEGPFEEPAFHSLRKSRHNDSKNQGHGNRPPNNAWISRKQQDVEINDIDCTEDTPSATSSDKWASNRDEQRGKSSDGDFDFPSEPAKVSGSSDPYAYDEDDDSDIWEKQQTRNKKNFRKGGSRSAQADVDWEPKGPQRPRGAGTSQQSQKSRNTKLRLQKGQIAPPNQHGQNPRPKGGNSQHMEGETNARNSANNEGRWFRNDAPGIEDSSGSGISPKSFFAKPGQSRNSTQARRSRDNPRPDDMPSPPSTSEDSPDNVACPLCAEIFPKHEIQVHASDCCGPGGGGAEGENLNTDEDQDGEEPDKAVVEVKSVESTEELSYILCKLCNHRFTKKSEYSKHFKECVEIHTTPSKKRANSIDDDGPVKKTRCGD
ncbi:uncharacterized protein LOC117647251 isoform X2 [Thrips palmi]|nr:uncharacterized protein LOC117647251 isoform X2 [Thrips palmi]